eukprot:scaffold302003_cov18-Tisochrysis_lutea.AAC.1
MKILFGPSSTWVPTTRKAARFMVGLGSMGPSDWAACTQGRESIWCPHQVLYSSPNGCQIHGKAGQHGA